MNIGFDDQRLLGIVEAYVVGTIDGSKPPSYDDYLAAVLELWERGINPMIEKRIVPIPADKSRPEPFVITMARDYPAMKARREAELNDPAFLKGEAPCEPQS